VDAAAPRLVEKVPMIQRLQVAAPVTLVKVPASQLEQGALPPMPYVPGVHGIASEWSHIAADKRSSAVRKAMFNGCCSKGRDPQARY
jgi:hypothetical protein